MRMRMRWIIALKQKEETEKRNLSFVWTFTWASQDERRLRVMTAVTANTGGNLIGQRRRPGKKKRRWHIRPRWRGPAGTLAANEAKKAGKTKRMRCAMKGSYWAANAIHRGLGDARNAQRPVQCEHRHMPNTSRKRNSRPFVRHQNARAAQLPISPPTPNSDDVASWDGPALGAHCRRLLLSRSCARSCE